MSSASTDKKKCRFQLEIPNGLLSEMEKDQSDIQEFKTALGLHIENPWERVKLIFLKNNYGERHPDLHNALDSAEVSFLGGVIFGGIIGQREYLLKIKETSDANIYHNKMDAYRQMSQESLKGFLKGAFKWGPRVAVFVGSFSLFASCVEAYRNESGIVEYSMSGSLVGGMLRFNFGVKGILVGSLVGCVLGTLYGIGHLGVLKMTQTNGVQIKYAQYALSKHFEKQAAKRFKGEGEELQTVPLASNSDFLSPLNSVSIGEEQKKSGS